MQVLRVAATSRATSVAGAIAWAIRQDGKVELHAIGAGAVNQATKAVAIARGYLVTEGVDIALVPSFEHVSEQGQDRTAVCFVIEPRTAESRPAKAVPDAAQPLELAMGA